MSTDNSFLGKLAQTSKAKSKYWIICKVLNQIILLGNGFSGTSNPHSNLGTKLNVDLNHRKDITFLLSDKLLNLSVSSFDIVCIPLTKSVLFKPLEDLIDYKVELIFKNNDSNINAAFTEDQIIEILAKLYQFVDENKRESEVVDFFTNRGLKIDVPMINCQEGGMVDFFKMSSKVPTNNE